MLRQLTIQNFGLIDRLTVEFAPGLNILTGETGAGKSILIDALRCALGERIEASCIRQGSSNCLIEAVFELTDRSLRSQEHIAEHFCDDDTDLIIQRAYSTDGKNKIKINGLSVTLGQLKTTGNHLIDFHGPHDHQMLLSEDQHLLMLDQLIDFKNLKSEYIQAFKAYEDIRRQLHSLQEMAATRQRDLDILQHQVKELEALPLSEQECALAQQERTKLNNAQKLHEHIQNLLGLLDDEETGVNALLRKSFGSARALAHIDESTGILHEQLGAMQEISNDLVGRLTDYGDSLHFDPDTARRINETCDAYSEIKRKYGPSLDDAQKLYEESRQKLLLLSDFDHNDKLLREQLLAKEKELSKIAARITKARQKAADDLNCVIEAELKDLGIAHVRFEVRFEKVPFNADGQDRAVFYISPNAGEDLKPLAGIVSSGEAARVMLALKKALIKVDPIPVLIFDEIDAQIGGRLGTITGRKLKELSQDRQVILITHLPQIASFADRHFKVVKTVKSGRAATGLQLLEAEARVQEIAQMMSGQSVSRISISHAQDMLEKAHI